MPRTPKLRKKKVGKTTYWFTATGGEATYFGNVKEVSCAEAKTQFTEFIDSLSKGTNRSNVLTSLDLMELFLDWVKENRSAATFDHRQRYCTEFANYKVGGTLIADIPALHITGDHMQRWLKARKKGCSPQTLLHSV